MAAGESGPRRGGEKHVGGRASARPSSDDDAELDLQVESVGAFRPNDWLAVGDDGVGELREEERPFRRLATRALGNVIAIVQADTDDLSGLNGGKRSKG